MATILDDEEAWFFVDMEDDEEPEEKIVKVNTWIRDRDTFRPSVALQIQNKLDPGVYCVEYNRDLGYYSKKITLISDALYVFKDNIIKPLIDEINLFWDKKDLYKDNKLVHKRGILLEGYAGTGKSSIISLLCNEVVLKGGIVFKVMGEDNLNAYITFIRNSFRSIEPETPVITIIEDINTYEQEEMLLDFLDGKTSINHHVVLATTNDTTNIEDTFLRPSRLDLRIEISLPSEETRLEYFLNKKVEKTLAEKLSKQTESFSLADLKEVFITTHFLNYSVEDAINKIKDPKVKKNFLKKKIGNKNLGL